MSAPDHAALFEKILLAPTGASTHVHDHDVAGAEFGCEDLFHIGEELPESGDGGCMTT